MTKKRKKNRQTQRSRIALQEALLTLLASQPYNKISISNITEQADLARSTFYSHFETKDDLLISYIDDIFVDFFRQISEGLEGDHSGKEASHIDIELFQIWKENADILELIRNPNVDSLILKRFRFHHERIYRTLIADRDSAINPRLASYFIAFLANSAITLLITWTENGMQESPEEMGQLLYQLSGPEVLMKLEADFASKILIKDQ